MRIFDRSAWAWAEACTQLPCQHASVAPAPADQWRSGAGSEKEATDRCCYQTINMHRQNILVNTSGELEQPHPPARAD